jgi:hypothetical protein
MQLVTRSESIATPAADRPAVRLFTGADGRLWLRGDPDRPVRVVRCFPWTAPGRYLSLRDDDAERAFVADPTELDDASRDALDRALAEAGFLFTIRAIRQVTEEIEIRVWRVDTAQGPRTFQTARDRWPRELPGGGFLIRDVAGDLYFTPDPEELDPRSRSFLWAFVD